MRTVRALGAGLLVLLALATLWFFFFPQVFPLRDGGATQTFRINEGGRRRVLFRVGPGNPAWTPLRRIARPLRVAVVTSEDDRFYVHGGLDFVELRRSVARNLEAGAYVRGASTITMQLARTLFLSGEKTLRRKVLETLLALELELLLDKDRILELYLNVVDWGPGVRGIGRAARVYYGKPPGALDWGEAAYLAVMLPNPRRYQPTVSPLALRERQRRLVSRLSREHKLPPGAAVRAFRAPPPRAAVPGWP